jgi:nucleoside-diphosphate-sugar epimerase
LCKEDDFSLTVLTRQKINCQEKNVSYVQGDILDETLLEKCVDQADYVVHMAGCKNDQKSFSKTNIEGTKNLIDACKATDCLKKIIYLSSVGVIGKTSDILIDEKTICNPVNEYERTKLEAERIVKDYSNHNPGKTVILRPTNVFGEDDPQCHLLNLLTNVQNNRFCFVGKNRSRFYLNYLYVKEISELISSLLFIYTSSDVYIINTPVKLNDFIAMIKEKFNDDKLIRHLPYWPVKILVYVLDWAAKLTNRNMLINSDKLAELTNKKFYSASLLQNDIGWKPVYSIKNAISKVTDYYYKQGMLN